MSIGNRRSSDDGWRTARAADLGVDEAALARAVQRIIDIDPSAPRAWLIHSMAIAYKGKLILDEYFYGHAPEVPHDMRSASKTFSSVTLGGAMLDGARISPQTKLYEVMAPLGPFANPDPRKDRVTLAHVMTHTTGLACDDNADSPSPGGEDVMQTQRAQPDWWKFTLDLPIVHEPGERYAYCSGGISLTGGALTMATGEWLPALFDRTIAKPLQFGSYYWNVMPTGEGYVGGGTFVRTRDFLKVGQAWLDGGVWNGRRIVTEAWVKDSIAPHARISPETTGVSGDTFANDYYDTTEGYAWHHINVQSGDRNYPAYHGNGNGGQLLLVLPQFDLAVMFTAGNYRQGLWNRERDDIVGEMILPALGLPRIQVRSGSNAASIDSSRACMPKETSTIRPFTKKPGVPRKRLPRRSRGRTDFAHVGMRIEIGGEARDVELEHLGVLLEVDALQARLPLEQHVVHFPEPALCAGTLGGLGGGQRKRMRLFEREVAVRETNLRAEMLQQHLDGRICQLAGGALEVAVFDDGHGGIARTPACGPSPRSVPRDRVSDRVLMDRSTVADR